MTVLPEDAALAYTLVRKQFSLLTNDLRFNVCEVDRPSVTGSLDLVGFFVNRFQDCPGFVWVELKAWGATKFEEQWNKQKEEFQLGLRRSVVETLRSVVYSWSQLSEIMYMFSAVKRC